MFRNIKFIKVSEFAFCAHPQGLTWFEEKNSRIKARGEEEGTEKEEERKRTRKNGGIQRN